MSAGIAIFVKTPRLSPVKTRLAARIGEEDALAFYQMSVNAVEASVSRSGATGYWAVAEADGVDDWTGFEAMFTGAGCLGTRQYHIYKMLLERHEKAILIGADAPQITPDLLNEAIERLERDDYVFGPARDGGYYLFGGRADVPPSIWGCVPWSAPNTMDVFHRTLPYAASLLPMLTDVDEQVDLAHMIDEMPAFMSALQDDVAAWAQHYAL